MRIVYGLGGALIPIPYSLVYLKQLEASGQLEPDARDELDDTSHPLGLG